MRREAECRERAAIVIRVVRRGLLRRYIGEYQQRSKEQAMHIFRGKSFQAEGLASTEGLSWVPPGLEAEWHKGQCGFNRVSMLTKGRR